MGGAFVFVVSALLYLYHPAIPRSLAGWAALIGLGLPVWMSLEWTGKTLLRSRFLARQSNFLRVLLGVPVIAVLMLLAALAVQTVQWAINTW
jgi:hypothetical protein